MISAHWSRSKCFSRNGEQGVCVMVYMQEEEETVVVVVVVWSVLGCDVRKGREHRSALHLSRALPTHMAFGFSVLTLRFV